ncbi:zinc-binding dehydrogenase [Lactococcus protaetiae]|uniref:zinc-binding dehydrogenase n=1 Tax=Lactococcus protaetiae TaxID=2592653 RepID=UPI001CC1D164|nr:zinc-binding dehydrogenase [Lactococcus protaetiae]
MKNINITAVTDLFSHDTLEVGLALGIKPEKMSTIIMMPEPPAGIARATGGASTKEDMSHILKYIISGELKVPLAGKFDLTDYQVAVELQASRHAHGKVIITL